MKHSRIVAIWIFTAACSVCFAGCSDIAESSIAEPASLTLEAAKETDVQTQQTQTEIQDTQTTLSSFDNYTVSSSNAAITEAYADSEESSSASSETSVSSDAVIGDTEMTAAKWCAQAQQIYETAATTYFTYLCSSDGFTYDAEDCIDGGWYRVTNCNTLEDAEAEYYSVFAKSGHETDLDKQFQIVDEKLYRLCGDRGADISYLDSKVTELLESTTDTLTFSVVSTYQFPDASEITTQEDRFTLVWERDAWRVGQFTMPY